MNLIVLDMVIGKDKKKEDTDPFDFCKSQFFRKIPHPDDGTVKSSKTRVSEHLSTR